jgi:hypothetical protein
VTFRLAVSDAMEATLDRITASTGLHRRDILRAACDPSPEGAARRKAIAAFWATEGGARG